MFETHQIMQIFNRTYNGNRNFMTPRVLGYGQKGGLLYELSEGGGIFGKALYGVTVITTHGQKAPELSQCFHSYREANDYAEALGDK